MYQTALELLISIYRFLGWRLPVLVMLNVVNAAADSLRIISAFLMLPFLGVMVNEQAFNAVSSYFMLLGIPHNVYTIAIFVVLIFSLQAAIYLVQSWMVVTYSESYTLHWRKKIFRAINNAEWRHFIKKSKGDILGVLSQESDRLYKSVSKLFLILGASVTVLAYAASAFLLSPSAAFLMGAVGMMMFFVHHFVVKRLASSAQTLIKGRQVMMSISSTFLDNVKFIKASGRSKIFVRLFEAELDRLFFFSRKSSFIPSVFTSASEMLVLITAVLSILAIVALSPQAKHADALLVLVLFMRANGKISGILVIYQQMISTLTSYNKIRVYERELLSAAAVNKGELRYDGPCKDRDRVENVLSLSGVDVVLDGSKILKNCNITAKSNEIIALVGPSGAGKTTIVDSILRLNPLSAGTIAINNQDIESYRLDSWRQAISYVPQDPAIIAGTIAENIAFFQSQVSEEQIVYAAKCAGAHRFIESLPMSYQTQVGEGGTRLSGGQKQRVAIARAILTNPILLILDEATSALDQVSEREVMSALYELKGTIVIMIAHRLNTVRHADRIYVIDKGEVVENGSWEELVREKGVFNDLLSAPKE